MTSPQRDPTPRPTLFERLLHDVLDVVAASSGGRVRSAFDEWLDAAGRVWKQARNLDPGWQFSTIRTRVEIPAMVRDTGRGAVQDLREQQDAAGSGPLRAGSRRC